MKAKTAPDRTEEDKQIIREMEAEWAEEDRLEREGKLKPWPKHLQDKMNSSGFRLLREAPAAAKPADAAE